MNTHRVRFLLLLVELKDFDLIKSSLPPPGRPSPDTLFFQVLPHNYYQTFSFRAITTDNWSLRFLSPSQI